MDAPIQHTLCRSLEGHIGEVLTPEVAAEIVARTVVMCYPGPVDTSAIQPRVVGSYTLRCASMAEALPKLHGVHAAHWQETEEYRHGLPFKPDYDRALDLEQQGRCLMVVVEHNETQQLVGNYGFYLSRSMHTQTLMATEDVLFIEKQHRRGRLAVELIRYAEDALRALGVTDLNVSVKLVNQVGPMLLRMGYRETGKQYVKILKDSTDVLS